MAKDSSRSSSGVARQRRHSLVVQRTQPRLESVIVGLTKNPNMGYALLIGLGFLLLGSLGVIWAREQVMLSPGRIAPETIHARVSFDVVDRAATENERLSVSQAAPSVLVAITSELETIQASISSLPSTLAAAETPEDVEPTIRERYGLDASRLAAVRGFVDEQSSGPSQSWLRASENLARSLESLPLVDARTFQLEENSPRKRIELVFGDRRVQVPSSDVLSVDNESRLRAEIGRAVALAGFSGPAAETVTHRLVTGASPTFRLDAAQSEDNRAAAAAGVQPVIVTTPVGTPLIMRGDVVGASELDKVEIEKRMYSESAPAWRVWLPRLSLAGGVLTIAVAAGGYVGLFNERIRRNPDRMLGLALLLLLGLYLSASATSAAPHLWGLTGIAPTLLVTAVLAIAYDQRTAIALGSLEALLVSLALDHAVGSFAALLTGVGALVFLMREIRDRRAIMRAGLGVSVVLAIATAAVAAIDRPMTVPSLQQTAYDALLAGLGGLVVATVTLALLSSVERVFDITTGMTLIELRDPKQPLLREMQQRAPGTYNHSLNVASISESAADAIGADALLTYVGALYHDVGKMNKPEYFIENQGQSPSKHDSLSPAMSLLVIVGHVKDGIELAREFHIPRPLHHFIEAHHGTTLVEYFYHRAKQEAEAEIVMGDDSNRPAEFDYRYPGPKPHTKEVAILMIADAVESATRSLAEPTPSRIESLVETIARKRLDDGQFDECGLTLRELRTVTDSIIKSLTAIYHGRVAYPGETHSGQESGKTPSKLA